MTKEGGGPSPKGGTAYGAGSAGRNAKFLCDEAVGFCFKVCRALPPKEMTDDQLLRAMANVVYTPEFEVLAPSLANGSVFAHALRVLNTISAIASAARAGKAKEEVLSGAARMPEREAAREVPAYLAAARAPAKPPTIDRVRTRGVPQWRAAPPPPPNAEYAPALIRKAQSIAARSTSAPRKKVLVRIEGDRRLEAPAFFRQMLDIGGMRAPCAVIAPPDGGKRLHLVVNNQAVPHITAAYDEFVKVSNAGDALPRIAVNVIEEPRTLQRTDEGRQVARDMRQEAARLRGDACSWHHRIEFADELTAMAGAISPTLVVRGPPHTRQQTPVVRRDGNRTAAPEPEQTDEIAPLESMDTDHDDAEEEDISTVSFPPPTKAQRTLNQAPGNHSQ